TLYLLRGLPGSGKSTLAVALNIGLRGALWAEADSYFLDEDMNYTFDASKLTEAHKECQDRVRMGMGIGIDIIVSNTLTTEKELKPYLELAEEFGYRVVSLIVENRHGGKSVHDVPESTVEKMRKRFDIKL